MIKLRCWTEWLQNFRKTSPYSEEALKEFNKVNLIYIALKQQYTRESCNDKILGALKTANKKFAKIEADN